MNQASNTQLAGNIVARKGVSSGSWCFLGIFK